MVKSGVNLCGNGWERSSHTYFQVGTPFPHLFICSRGNAVPTAFRHYIHWAYTRLSTDNNLATDECVHISASRAAYQAGPGHCARSS